MLLLIYPLLLLLPQSFFAAQAAPAAIEPASLSLNTLLPADASWDPGTISSLFDEDQIASLALLLNTSNVGDEVIRYRVPGTHTILGIGLQDTPLPKAELGRTILRTQQSLSAFIRTHDAEDETLADADDPYESDPAYEGCHFGVTTYPLGYSHLTYGIVMNVLQGLWFYLYREGRFQTALFEVRDDQFGSVGIGKVSQVRPVRVVKGGV